ncbi:MAG: M24 family metallopeptidase [Hyphomicrobiaceae bacterium]|nr:M24 family metallopeptidase [Hyphomicrobiaceae bacterium]
MYQSFEAPAGIENAPDRVKRLRALLGELGVDAVLVPRADEHQGEYVPASADRLKWLTGFSGSAGTAVVARRAAALFVDGRYTVQARAQVDAGELEVLQVPQARVSEWLCEKLEPGAAVGFDPRLHTVGEIERLTDALADRKIKLKPLGRNPVDRIWGPDRPAPPTGKISPHPLRYAGLSAEEKIAALQKGLKAESQDAVVLTLPDSIAWLFNIRGSDVAHNPVPLAFAIVPAQGKPELFVVREKLDAEARAHLRFAKVSDPSTLGDRLARLKASGKRVRLDPDTASWWFARQLGGPRRIQRGQDPCILPKARKNAAEIEGARAAHLRDGAAFARFLAWLDRESPGGRLDEITAARRLEQLRAETQALKDISFDTISGSGPHGAIVHYRVTEATNRKLKPGELYLVDSGGQYLDGTTDITRTVAIGRPAEEMRERYTLVLKGHIAIATARFPKSTRGIDLDAFARRALWDKGLDFDHGTGHGVGSYLSVHEGPQSISRRGMAALEPGMIVSNEPGYYKEGAYGIRLENLVLVTEPEKVPGGDRETMGFETLTLAPFDRRLVKADLLTPAEVEWLDAYHARVRAAIGPELGPEDRAWLEAATAPVG